MSKREYDVVIGKLRRDVDHWEDAVNQSEELALNAQAMFGHILSSEEIFSVAFLSGVRWQMNQQKPKDGVI